MYVFVLTCRAAAMSSAVSALFLHSAFSLLCFSSSAEYMAFSSARRQRHQRSVQVCYFFFLNLVTDE